MQQVEIYNENCIGGANRFKDESVDLIICDPPFAISEKSFGKHYNRKQENVIDGYVEAPPDYGPWVLQWLSQAKRVLKPNGSMYIVSGYSKLFEIEQAVRSLSLFEINHIVWKYNFGVNAKKKFVSSHYHILYLKKDKRSQPTFNTFCRFGASEKTEDGRSRLYADLEDVWIINREYCQGKLKNSNKLPEELVSKMIQYSSNPDDLVCDFFMGNFTTASVAKRLGRRVCGFELNQYSYNHHMPLLDNVEFGCDLKTMKIVHDHGPENQGKRLDQDTISQIYAMYDRISPNMTKAQSVAVLCNEFKRGRFSIEKLLTRRDNNGN
jgi:site-specific DNA-methyltransferase (adenine-specific)